MSLVTKLSLLAALGGLFSSCTPFPPEDPNTPKTPQPDPVPVVEEKKKKTQSEVERQKEESRKRLERKKRDAERRKKEAEKKKEESSNVVEKTDPVVKPPVKPTSKYPTALAIPGRPGEVFNPYTNAPVDVSGVPSGRLVTDPNDAQGRKFRVP